MRSRAACLKSKSFNFRPFSSTYIDNPSRAGKSRSTPRIAAGDSLTIRRTAFADRKNHILTPFHRLGLAAPIAQALVEEKYITPTPIQVEAIPHVLAGRDLVGIAQTGTGKTAAFALPILHHLVSRRFRPERRHCRVLVLSPTRELSGQILESFKTYGRHVRPTVALAIGGVPINRQVRALSNGVDVLVATPGRLLDLMQSQAVKLDRVEVLVLDEADRMLDMGFIHDIRAIVAKLPAERQTLFFSATMPDEIEKLAAKLLRNPIRVAVTPPSKTADRINQRVIHVDRNGKNALLAEVLRDEATGRTLVFTRTKRGADRVVKSLASAGIHAEAIHGNKSQNQRERVLASFREGRLRTLIATDIAARGIDVDGITHVVNFDLPNIADSYIHRIGRTARAGAEGIAISFCDHEERAYLRDIEKLIRAPIAATDRRGNAQPRSHQAHQPHPGHQPHGSHQKKKRRPGRNHRGPQRGQSHGHGHHAEGRPAHREGRHQPRPAHAHAAAAQPDRGGELTGVAFLHRKRDQRPAHGHTNGPNGAHRHSR
jgi:ATP-dependent RNA helicase RhlE